MTMYQYVECGLPNVYLANGYEQTYTPHGPRIAIRDAEQLHVAVAHILVVDMPWLTGEEARFIRESLDLTQAQLGELLGEEEQHVRCWEKLERVPQAVDHAIRLVFRNLAEDAARRPATWARAMPSQP
jgi:putative transcriptional regulator